MDESSTSGLSAPIRAYITFVDSGSAMPRRTQRRRMGMAAILLLAFGAPFLPLVPAGASTTTTSGALAAYGTTQVNFVSEPGTITAALSCTGKARIVMVASDPSGAELRRLMVNCRSGSKLSVVGTKVGTYTLRLYETRGLSTNYSLTVTTPRAGTTTTTVAPTTTTVAPPTTTTVAPPTTTTVAPPTTTTVAPPTTTTVAPPNSAVPVTPPARICGNRAILDGPTSPPAGAVRINPGQNLQDATVANPAGTTFWLAPGTHTLTSAGQPGAEFSQVVPKDGNTYVGAPGSVLDGQKVNRYAFTQLAANVTVKHLTVTGFVAPGDEAVVNHDSARGWVIERNTIHHNGGAGAYLGDNNRLSQNCLTDNSQYGFQGGGASLTVDRNEIARNNTFDYETQQPGCGCSGGAKFWAAGPGTVTNNWVHDNTNVGLWWDNNNTGFLVEGNLIEGSTAEAIVYETSYNFRIVGNTLRQNTKGKGQAYQSRGDPFPIGTIYISEAGGDSRIGGGLYAASEISRNVFEDNWAGVVLWENSDRFGHDDSANTSKGYTTLAVDPTGSWPSPERYRCGPDHITTQPNYENCRWWTQNVLVTDNDFRLSDKAAIGCTSAFCAQQGTFANGGTQPSWSPYKGSVIQEQLTFHRNNHFRANRYSGPWRFTGYETRIPPLTWDEWRTAPYSQDAGSTLTGGTATTTTTVPARPR